MQVKNKVPYVIPSFGRLEGPLLNKFVNREEELKCLIDRADKEVVIGVCGDASMGKSSLLEKFAEKISKEKGYKVIFLRFDNEEEGRHVGVLCRYLSTSLFDQLPRWQRCLASLFQHSLLTKVVALTIVSIASFLLNYALTFFKILAPLTGLVISVILLPVFFKALDHVMETRLTRWARSMIPPPLGKIGCLKAYIYDAIKVVCVRVRRLIVIIDDLKNINKADREFIFELIQNVLSGRLSLRDKISFVLGWRISHIELQELGLSWLIPYMMELRSMRKDGIIRIFEQEGVIVLPQVKDSLHKLVRGNPGFARAIARYLKSQGIDVLDDQSIDVVRDIVSKNIYEKLLHELKEWKWLYESLAILGSSPAQLKVLEYVAEEFFSVEKAPITILEGLSILRSKGVIRYSNTSHAYMIVPESLRELIYGSIEPYGRWRIHSMISEYYEEYVKKAKKTELLMILDAIINHVRRARDVQDDIELIKREFKACIRLADLYLRMEKSPGTLASGIEYPRRAIRLARELNDALAEFKALESMAYYASMTGIPREEADEYVRSLKQLFERLRDQNVPDLPARYAWSLSYFAEYYSSYLGYSEEAIRRSLSLIDEAIQVIGDSPEERAIDELAVWLRARGILLSHKASIMARLYGDKFVNAKRCLEERRELVERYKDAYISYFGIYEYNAAMSSICYRLGDIYLLEGKLDEALKCYEEHLMYERKKGYLAGEGTALYRKAIALLHLGANLKQVLNLLLSAKKKLSMAGVIKYMILCNCAIGLVYACKELPKEALQHLDEALQLAASYMYAPLEEKVNLAKMMVIAILQDRRREILADLMKAYERPMPNVLDDIVVKALSITLAYLDGALSEEETIRDLEILIKEARERRLGALDKALSKLKELSIEGLISKGDLMRVIANLIIQPY